MFKPSPASGAPKDYLDELAEQAYRCFQKECDRHVPDKTLFSRCVKKVLPPNGGNHHDSVSTQAMMLKEIGQRLNKLISANRPIKLAHPLARFDRNTKKLIRDGTPLIKPGAELVAETARIMHVEQTTIPIAVDTVLRARKKPELSSRVKGDTESFFRRRKAIQLWMILGSP